MIFIKINVQYTFVYLFIFMHVHLKTFCHIIIYHVPTINQDIKISNNKCEMSVHYLSVIYCMMIMRGFDC